MNNITLFPRPCIFLLLCSLFYIACKREAPSSLPARAKLTAQQSMTFPANACEKTLANHLISRAYATQLIENYQTASRIPGRVCQLYEQGGWVLAETFPANAVKAMLNQTGICGFRIYNGLDTDNRQHMVLVGVDEYGFDALSADRAAKGAASDTSGPMIMEMGLPCPQACGGLILK
jgi:hypothetical protein